MTSPSPDIKIIPETPIRAPSAVPVDDAVLPFEVASLDLRGRLTRLGPAGIAEAYRQAQTKKQE